MSVWSWLERACRYHLIWRTSCPLSFIPADGIIIRSDASQEVNDLIAEAKEQDIPVVSVIDDYSGQT